MILAAVDDLLFRSKIRTVGNQVGATLVFARTTEEIIAQAKAVRPRLVVLDLNNDKSDPIGTIAALKRDPELAAIPILGFASHVHVDLIRAARIAGADDVLPRSAFAANLGQILSEPASP
jgi:CheY-like chemotaxis protein